MVREMIKKNSDKYEPDLPQVMLVSLVRYLNRSWRKVTKATNGHHIMVMLEQCQTSLPSRLCFITLSSDVQD